MPRVFNLAAYQRAPRQPVNKVLITPKDIEQNVAAAAWSFAVRNTAKGLEMPDYDAAIQLMLERHPSWEIIDSPVLPASVNLTLADEDRPENT